MGHYVDYVKSKTHQLKRFNKLTSSSTPVLNDDDEAFFSRFASRFGTEKAAAARQKSTQKRTLDWHGGDAQIALMDGAQNIPLPESPPENNDQETVENKTDKRAEKQTKRKSRKSWGWLLHKDHPASDLADSAQHVKPPELNPAGDEDFTQDKSPEFSTDEQSQEQKELTEVLERLNLAACDNQVFSISNETNELLRKFKQVLKDLMNGVPTAYNDLESLLRNSDGQIQEIFSHLPSSVRKVIEKMPDKMTQKFAPEMLALASESADRHNISLDGPATASKLVDFDFKKFVSKPAALAGMLRSVVSFLRTRFPMVLGANVLWSLALSLLLLVLWYCHKRGREVRLQKEAEAETGQRAERHQAEVLTAEA